MLLQRRLSKATRKKGCGCGCLTVLSVGLLTVSALFVMVLDPDDTSVVAPTGFSAFAIKDIPLQYLVLYQGAAATYPGLPAQLLAAVGKVESNHGRSRAAGVHQPARPDHLLGARAGSDDGALANFAGAAGPMQIGIGGAATSNFQGGRAWGSPWDGTWHGAIHPAPPSSNAPVARYGYGVDGGDDGYANVYDPADAIFTGARMLHTAWDKRPNDLWKAVYAYNHGGAGVPSQHDAYVTAVWDYYDQYTSWTAPAGTNGPGMVAVAWALQQRGKPYVYGAEGPNSFDCSGLVMMAYRHAGINLPRVAAEQYRYTMAHGGAVYSPELLQPGDLVFYEHLGHVMIYIGNAKLVEAPHTGDVVKVISWKAALGDGLVGVTRPSKLSAFSKNPFSKG
ncbi:MAG TPA: C40 family peptidase [Actinomycetes bacterium]|nr:C40 family peptidase [Actinomycetes bacterium]